MKKSCIHFIRHGITEGIVNRWYYGETDLPLIDEGILQLNKFRDEGIYPSSESAACYTSGMLRANQTFEVLFGHSNYQVISDLREMNFGSWECKTFDELKALEGFDLWINDKSGTFTFPGGDSSVSFQERVSKGLDELLKRHFLRGCPARVTEDSEDAGNPEDAGKPEDAEEREENSAIVVCHGGVIASCMCMRRGEPTKAFWDWIPGPGRGYTVYFEGEKASGYEKI